MKKLCIAGPLASISWLNKSHTVNPSWIFNFRPRKEKTKTERNPVYMTAILEPDLTRVNLAAWRIGQLSGYGAENTVMSFIYRSLILTPCFHGYCFRLLKVNNFLFKTLNGVLLQLTMS